MKNVKRVVVVMGGPSAEAEVSMATGSAIAKALRTKDYYEVIELKLDPKNFTNDIIALKPDLVFNAVHGLYGEDGRLQSVLDMLEIPYTGSNVIASAVAMDKVISKKIFIADNICTPKSLFLNIKDKSDFKALILEKFTLPIVVKPASQGSSIGVEIVKTEDRLILALEEAFKYCDDVLVEEFITGYELTASVLKEKDALIVFPVIKIVPNSGVYDYKSKYTKGSTSYLCPAPISKQITEKVQQMAIDAYKSLGCAGVARADFIVDKKENIFILEVNTVPGMTATSLVPKAAKTMGIEFEDLCDRIIKAI
jgi:D-alanine--D-alanine ligase